MIWHCWLIMNSSEYLGCNSDQFTSLFGFFVQGQLISIDHMKIILRVSDIIWNHFVLSSFSKTVSGILGSVALSFLIIKRYREPSKSRRSWTVWGYDTSKQVLGMLFVHFANIVWASYISGKFTGDACSLYLLSFLLDSSVGLFIIYISLKIVDLINLRLKWWMMTVGKYSRDERVVEFDLHSIRPWIVQTLIFLLKSVS